MTTPAAETEIGRDLAGIAFEANEKGLDGYLAAFLKARRSIETLVELLDAAERRNAEASAPLDDGVPSDIVIARIERAYGARLRELGVEGG